MVHIQIKLTDDQKQLLKRAATHTGAAVTPWARTILLREARQVLGLT